MFDGSTSAASDSAAAVSRRATVTTLPVTLVEPETTASPVAMPARTEKVASPAAFCSREAAKTASAHLAARSGSSSCAVGAPKTATSEVSELDVVVPPNRSTSAWQRDANGASVASTSSGSSAVVASSSATNTVTTLRSRISGGASAGGKEGEFTSAATERTSESSSARTGQCRASNGAGMSSIVTSSARTWTRAPRWLPRRASE